MAKRKQGNVPTKGRAEGFEDKSASRLAVKNFEDVADSEDEFFINKDKILLEEGPDAKRRKQLRPIGVSETTYRVFSRVTWNLGNSTTNDLVQRTTSSTHLMRKFLVNPMMIHPPGKTLKKMIANPSKTDQTMPRRPTQTQALKSRTKKPTTSLVGARRVETTTMRTRSRQSRMRSTRKLRRVGSSRSASKRSGKPILRSTRRRGAAMQTPLTRTTIAKVPTASSPSYFRSFK